MNLACHGQIFKGRQREHFQCGLPDIGRVAACEWSLGTLAPVE
jgi:hypothetical protein